MLMLVYTWQWVCKFPKPENHRVCLLLSTQHESISSWVQTSTCWKHFFFLPLSDIWSHLIGSWAILKRVQVLVIVVCSGKKTTAFVAILILNPSLPQPVLPSFDIHNTSRMESKAANSVTRERRFPPQDVVSRRRLALLFLAAPGILIFRLIWWAVLLSSAERVSPLQRSGGIRGDTNTH